MAQPLITFTSDFGHADWFVGIVHGVLNQICPGAHVIDLTHEIPPGNVARAAFVLEASAPDFPPETVHLVVVDPGVGTRRRAIAVQARGQWFVGPDNGVLDWALSAPGAKIHELSETRYFRAPVSRTFHGRDVFAPVAGHLACGVAIHAFGPAVSDPVRLPTTGPQHADGRITGRIMLLDRFGNALTNITAQDLSDAFAKVPEANLEARFGGRTVRGLARSYGDAPVGTVLVIVGSSGRLEIAQVGGDVSTRLGLGEGDEVIVSVSS